MLRRAHLALLKIFKRLPRRARLAIVHAIAPSFTVGSICVIERVDDHVLLVRHSYRERWGFPGGLLARGESPPDAARREAREECVVDIEIVGEPAVVVDPDARRVDVIFRCRMEDGQEPRAVPPEVTDVGWFPTNALPELQHEAAEALVALARGT